MIEIVKASKIALGGIVGRTKGETTPHLAKAVWLYVLTHHAKADAAHKQRDTADPDFNIPLRRKLPIQSPALLDQHGFRSYNARRTYDLQIKPFGFLQVATVASETSGRATVPIAPFEQDVGKSRRLPWIDLHTGKSIVLDWNGTVLAGTIAVMRLDEYVGTYWRHPESKAADANGKPADESTVGILQRLHVKSIGLVRIGKEVDRLDEDDGVSLTPDDPVRYDENGQSALLTRALEKLAVHPRAKVAQELGMSERRWRDVVKRQATPRKVLRFKIIRLANDLDRLLSTSRESTAS